MLGIFALIFLAPLIPVILIGLIACDRCRAFLGYNILAFGGMIMVGYLVHLAGY